MITRVRGLTWVTVVKGLTGVTREARVSKEEEGGGEEGEGERGGGEGGEGEGKDVTMAGQTNEQGKIGLLSQWMVVNQRYLIFMGTPEISWQIKCF